MKSPAGDGKSEGVDRAEFLRCLTRALGRERIVAPPDEGPVIDPELVRVLGAGEPAELFASRAATSGMIVHRACAGEAAACVRDVLVRAGCRRVAMAQSEALAGIAELLADAGMSPVEWWKSRGVEGLYEADAGVTDVQAAIAESGTLVCTSGRGRARGLSLVPPIHVAVVKRAQVVADLIDYLRLAGRPGDAMPGGVVLITGPSKTADIEGILITGVHGPREVHVVLEG